MAKETTEASGLAGRYAAALYELAEADGKLDEVAGDLRRLMDMIGESGDLARAMRSPVISRDDQGKAMAELAVKAGLSDLTRRFVGVVARNRRLFAISGIIRAYLDMLAAGRGETSADVTSAAELSDAQLKRVAASLKKAMGVDVTLNTHVDPDLLGGLVVKIGSRMIDSSLRTKLQHLRLAMKGIG